MGDSEAAAAFRDVMAEQAKISAVLYEMHGEQRGFVTALEALAERFDRHQTAPCKSEMAVADLYARVNALSVTSGRYGLAMSIIAAVAMATLTKVFGFLSWKN